MTDQYFEEIWAKFLEDKPLPIPQNEHGSGNFGVWTQDGKGLPAYRYLMDPLNDSRAVYRTSKGDSRDHWHLVGNERLNATAHNNGHVQVYDWSRGGKCLNRWEPEAGHLSGGGKHLRVNGEAAWTLRNLAPSDLGMELLFGEGYVEKKVQWRGVTLIENICAPMDDTPVLVSSSAITNDTQAPIEVELCEYWGVNPHQLTPVPLMTHGLADFFERRRKRINQNFTASTQIDENSHCVRVDFNSPRLSNGNPQSRSMVDFFPKSVFLAALENTEEFPCEYVLQVEQAKGDILCIKRRATLAPGASAQFRYLYGVAEAEKIPLLIEGHRSAAAFSHTPAFEFHNPQLPWLTRELHWHGYYLQAGALYSDYYESHFIDQGSAYSYMQGLSGAPRDFALFTVPLVYLRPDLAKDALRFTLRSQCAKRGKFPYAHVGYGLQRGYVLHSYSSDLDLFTLWALAEYIGATQDHGFWQETLPYYPKESGASATVLGHAKASFAHLRDVVGLGKHGLIRSRSGDWNDVLMAYSGMPLLTFLRGESSLNAGLATFALPMLADTVESTDAAFANELREYAGAQKKALRQMMGREFVARGYLGYGGKKLGDTRLFLDAQGFGVIGGVWDEQESRELFEVIYRDCVAPQKAGALALWPPMKGLLLDPGSDTNGGTWAAIDAWTAWAWSFCDPHRAWDFFLSSTLAARAEAYPDTWYGVWSGPDSYNAHYHPRANETFLLNFTPMCDYPVMNMNRHACPLLAAIKMSGVRIEKNTITIDPKLPLENFSLRTPLLGFAYTTDSMKGCYTPVCDGVFRFKVKLPLNTQAPTLRINESQQPVTSVENGFLFFEQAASCQDRFTWTIG